MGLRAINNPKSSFEDPYLSTGTEASTPNIHPGMYATGGDIANRLQPGNGYIYHTFGADGTFTVDYALTNVEILLQGGGGGGRAGGGAAGGGGGAGGIYLASIPALPAGNYTIDVAAATAGGVYNAPAGSLDGKKTIFNPGGSAPLSYEAGGGGGAGGYGPPTDHLDGRPGTSNGNGAGGGGGGYPTGGTKGASSPMGRTGGDGEGGGDSSQAGGGGGGAGPPTDANFTSTSTLGEPGAPTGPRSVYRSWGGWGSQMDNYNYDLICDPTAPNGPAAATSLGQLDGYFGGGGAGAIREALNQIPARGGRGGGGWGGMRTAAISGGDANTYSGGGGGGDSPGPTGGDGASGILVVRYAEQAKSPSPGAKATGGVITTYNSKTIHTFRNTGTFTTPAAFNETVEYVVIGGGGSGGASNTDNPGGGGAGAYLTNSTPISGSNTIPVQVGDGGYRHNPGSDPAGLSGYPSFFGPTRVAAGGGGGGINTPGPTPNSPTTTAPGGRAGYPGGSGGGGGYSNGLGGTASGDPFPGTIGATPANGWGHDGATGFGGGASYWAAGGGGGAGGVGESSSGGGDGGAGIQLPATFRDPAAATTLGYPGPTSAPTPNGFDTSGNYWFCGGGGGGIDGATGRAPNPVSEGGGPGGPYAGAGPAGDGEWPAPGTPVATGSGLGVDAKANSGSGGGGNSVNALNNYGAGGSGIVIVAYPT